MGPVPIDLDRWTRVAVRLTLALVVCSVLLGAALAVLTDRAVRRIKAVGQAGSRAAGRLIQRTPVTPFLPAPFSCRRPAERLGIVPSPVSPHAGEEPPAAPEPARSSVREAGRLDASNRPPAAVPEPMPQASSSLPFALPEQDVIASPVVQDLLRQLSPEQRLQFEDALRHPGSLFKRYLDYLAELQKI